MSDTRNQTAEHFLRLIQRSKRGRLKVYIGMAAGVGKTYRMLQEAHSLLTAGVDVRIGYIETHGRKETAALLEGLPQIPRREVFYKGKKLDELDLEAVLRGQPEILIVDELAHTNIPGSKNEKRWQDVRDILDAGIHVITAVNIQHLESLNEEVRDISGVEVAERIPDSILKEADEVVNIDLTADELITRLRAGKIYAPEKVETALKNFFKAESILQLRELALKEVAGQIERQVETKVPKAAAYRHEKLLACIGTNADAARTVIRKTARLASYYNAPWTVLFIETPRTAPDRIPLDKQRHLLNNLKLATELGAAVVKQPARRVATAIADYALTHSITTICIGKPSVRLFDIIRATAVFNVLLHKLTENDVDLIILS